ncbi:hypothetical protein IV203_011403 [Nitzschia inconspicua]|uniref:DUF6824 domain-containing protein n=1 Tax=Nitzschia inconspicua TaxID=303405 RepID=A0A9K3PJ96_9STRA|nr:hypothetical protein IV203_011403 [Nitzschia inconspicua]
MPFFHYSLSNDYSLPTAVHTPEHHDSLSSGTEGSTGLKQHRKIGSSGTTPESDPNGSNPIRTSEPYCDVQWKNPPSSLAVQPNDAKGEDEALLHLVETYLASKSPSSSSPSPVNVSTSTPDDTVFTSSKIERVCPHTFGSDESLPTFITPTKTLKDSIAPFNDDSPQMATIQTGLSYQVPFLQSWTSLVVPSTADLDGPFDERNRLLRTPLLHSKNETTVTNNSSDSSPLEDPDCHLYTCSHPGQDCSTRNEFCVRAKRLADITTMESHNPTRRCATVTENSGSRKIKGEMKAPVCHSTNTATIQKQRTKAVRRSSVTHSLQCGKQTGKVAIMKTKTKRGPRWDDPINKTYLPLTDSDVIFGRGGQSNTHPGNINFRQLILAHQDYYQDLKDAKERTDFSSDFVAMIRHEQGGRFLKKGDHGWISILTVAVQLVLHLILLTYDINDPTSPAVQTTKVLLGFRSLESIIGEDKKQSCRNWNQVVRQKRYMCKLSEVVLNINNARPTFGKGIAKCVEIGFLSLMDSNVGNFFQQNYRIDETNPRYTGKASILHPPYANYLYHLFVDFSSNLGGGMAGNGLDPFM